MGTKSYRLQRANWMVMVCLGLLVIVGCEKVGCEKKEKGKEKGKILAKVGKTTLTEDEFYSLIPAQYRNMLAPSQKKELLQKWIDNELVYQKAVDEGINKEEELKLKLQQMEHEVVSSEFLDRYIGKIGNVEENEVVEYFNLHKDEYNSEREAAQIVVMDKEQAGMIAGKARAGEDFTMLVKQYSIDPSAQRGGSLGYIRRGDIPQLPEIEEALFSLKSIGDISEPVQTNFGYCVIKLLNIKKSAEEVKYETVKEKTRNYLDTSKRKKAFNELMDSLRAGKKVEANYNLFE